MIAAGVAKLVENEVYKHYSTLEEENHRLNNQMQQLMDKIKELEEEKQKLIQVSAQPPNTLLDM